MGQGYTFFGQCSATTMGGTGCKRKVVYANGLCAAHGGDSTEFMRERLRRIVAKSRARTERLRRRLKRMGIELPRRAKVADE